MHSNNSQCDEPFSLTIINQQFKLQQLTTTDFKLTGEQIIEKTGKLQPEEYILLHIQQDGMLEEINLRELVDISTNDHSFYLFKNDRTFNLELNGRRYPWGSNTINKQALQMIGNIPENHNLWLEKRSEADIEINGDICVNLDDSGLEKIYSKQSSVKIIINGKTKTVDSSELSFSELVELAFPNQPTNPNTAYTITYKRGCDCSPEGSLVKGESVCIKDGGVFNVTATDKS
ncbi:multiubiquitin domain-containing protein [Cocleimonas sp. KMM 6892]|uniref:multiubiquitin domain-containing protein n=1 Tax=unclassified Cocleimonas TaxID=2639732 RepID=UPI002DBB583F|nr:MULTISPECIES: multiubiquitin domain-containing protein [unclassified Cocleimonas]MEB8432586.1 multiubiquitin domain-containing protein [Cocleimonas sp. KMM 6892]MEC4715445.1 multiubiquitin domain-containing protein [Cocleimonas sp. KMM 6895]MEC4744936.1 multiubiquitin domain-containing protein [Cocleimonas sp. KMM 6896]